VGKMKEGEQICARWDNLIYERDNLIYEHVHVHMCLCVRVRYASALQVPI
jgi:hypothetical protein